MTKAQHIPCRQTFGWVWIRDMEMAPPAWGRAIRESDARRYAADFDADAIGTLCIWHRPDLPVMHGRYVILDGQHRCQACRLVGYNDSQVSCLLYEGLSPARAAELSRNLQDRRNLHALDRHNANVAALESRAVDIDKRLRFLDLTLASQSRAGDRRRLSAIGTIYTVWDRMTGPGLERVLTICGTAWDWTSAGLSMNCLKLVMTVCAAHNGTLDDAHLAAALSTRSPAQWIAKDVTPQRSLASIAQDVVIAYNRGTRVANRLTELTPSAYQAAAKRQPLPTVRGKVDATTTSAHGTRRTMSPQHPSTRTPRKT
jgi:hypothetical protein